MQRITIGRLSRIHLGVVLTLLCALALLGVTRLAPPALAAAADYTGGPGTGDYPLYVPNDHTVCALRFTAAAGTLLDKNGNPVTAAGANYYVKIRLSPSASPQGTSNRGFTWNPTTQTWVDNQDGSWADFPVATTTSGGALTAGNNWYYFKFGDTTKSGLCSLLVSLQPTDGGSGTTQNNASPPTVTVMDMSGTISGAQYGFWVHNATTTGFTGKRVEADKAGDTPVWALSRSVGSAPPTASVPPDGTGGANGDFVLGTPTGTGNPFDVKIQTTTWSAISSSLADVNIALPAVPGDPSADMTPPSAPGALSVTPGDTSASLSWGAATDNTGVSSYLVYRWTDPPAGATYTSAPVLVATVTNGTTYTNTGLTNGTKYYYLVRAEDAATNVGPRSITVAATPQAPTAVTLKTSASVVAWGHKATLSGTLTSGGSAVAGQTVNVQASVAGRAWQTVVSPVTDASGNYSASVSPAQATRYKAVFAAAGVYLGSASVTVKVTPSVKLGVVVAPTTVKKGKSFAVWGSLTPRMTPRSKTVRIKCYVKKGGTWALRKTFTATDANRGSASRYKATIKLAITGRWELVAYSPATSKYAATTASPTHIRVHT